MPLPRQDWLLKGTTLVFTALFWLMAFAAVALALAVPILLSFRSWVVAELAKQLPAASAPTDYWLMIGMIAGAFALVMLTALFLRQLIALIGTVAADPFVPENAGRLEVMAWLMLAAQGVGLLLAAVAWRFNDAMGKGQDDVSVSLNGVVLVLMLFILARIFRHGTALRAELEGTV